MMKITDPKLFEAIETAIASGNTVYLTSPDYQSIGDGPELIRNCALIRGKPGEFPADFFRTANSDQFLRVLKRYARFECEACGQSCETSITCCGLSYGKRLANPMTCCALDVSRID